MSPPYVLYNMYTHLKLCRAPPYCPMDLLNVVLANSKALEVLSICYVKDGVLVPL